MGAVEDTRKALRDFLAPELRTITAKLDALTKEQAQPRSELRSDLRDTATRLGDELNATEGRLRGEVIASEARVTAAVERLHTDMPLLIRDAVLVQLLAEKQRVIEDTQRSAH